LEEEAEHCKVLVPVSGAPSDTVAINAALVAAVPFMTHVQALFVPADPRLSIPMWYARLSQCDRLIVKSLEELNQQPRHAPPGADDRRGSKT
jgi:hypothetical protein